jgi:cyclophilin family peptidyl-prolyl cis-trans isomerase
MSVALLFACATAMGEETASRLTGSDNTAILQLDDGLVIIELNPAFAPETVDQFKRLSREGFYDGQSFYRVIDGFVAQGGDGSDMGVANAEPTIKAEFEREWSAQSAFVSVQQPDLFAPETGFIDGSPVARDSESGKVWLVHCPGAVAMARLDDPDSSSTDFYIVIGQAPRYLDRNLNIFGRVVYGMEIMQRLRRGLSSNGGVIDDAKERSAIRTVRIAADIPAGERPKVEVIDTNSEEFQSILDARRNRDAEFFYHQPPPVLDVCQIPNGGRLRQ